MERKIIENSLIPVYQRNDGVRIVDARELHIALGSKRQFADWVKDKLSKYGFTEGIDYQSYSQICEKPGGGRPTIEYDLTIDTAKELAMVENNEKGRQIRRYFIDVEKRQKALGESISHLSPELQMFNTMFQALAKQELEQKHIKEQLQIAQHRLDNIDNVNIKGDKQQRLNAMVRKYALAQGLSFSAGWKHFVQAFNTSYRTNLELLKRNFPKKVSTPQYLAETDRLDDALRVADKMLNLSRGA